VKVPGRALYEDDLFPLSIAMSVHELSPSLYQLTVSHARADTRILATESGLLLEENGIATAGVET
jgi:hypothetical protein